MKKLLVFILTLVLCLSMFSGCNKSYGFGNYEYNKVHIDTYHHSGCLTVEKWYEGSTGIEVKTKEAGSIFLSEGTYILLNGDKGCPFCDVEG